MGIELYDDLNNIPQVRGSGPSGRGHINPINQPPANETPQHSGINTWRLRPSGFLRSCCISWKTVCVCAYIYIHTCVHICTYLFTYSCISKLKFVRLLHLHGHIPYSLTRSVMCSLTRSWIQSFIHSSMHSFMHSFGSFICLFCIPTSVYLETDVER